MIVASVRKVASAQCYERFTAVTSYADGNGATLRAYLHSQMAVLV